MWFIRLARPYNTLLPIVAIIVGWLFTHEALSPELAYLLVAYVFIHSAVTLRNDVADVSVDVHNLQLGMARALQQHRMTVIISLWALTALSIVCAAFVSPMAILLVVLMAVVGELYDGTLVKGSHRPVLSIALLAVGYGLIPVLMGVENYDALTVPAVLLAAAWSLQRASLSLLKDFKDIKGDQLVGKRTALIRYGNRHVVYASLAFMVIGMVTSIFIVFYVFPRVEFAAILGAIFAWLVFVRVQLLKVKTHEESNQIFHTCLHYQLIFDVGMVAWLSI